MEKIKNILGINSNLSNTLKFSLHGLRASLVAAKNQFPDDQSISLCNELIAELEEILNLTNIEADPPVPSSDNFMLKSLKDYVTQNQDLKIYWGDKFLVQSETDEDLWQEIQLFLLRVPEKIVDHLKDEILKQMPDGVRFWSPSKLNIPYYKDKQVFPGLAKGIKAKGLNFSTQTDLDSRLNPQNQELTEDIAYLGKIVSACLKLIDLDSSNLYHAFEKVYQFGLMSLSKQEERERYVRALIQSFHRVIEPSQDIVSNLNNHIALDEAIHSLVYNPLAAEDSWWGNLQQEYRNKLQLFFKQARKEGHNVFIRSLSGDYRDVYKDTNRDQDIPLDQGETPGKVLTCLRVYSSIQGKVFPGRVIYRPETLR
ncbi:hypothetical protein [Planktothrix sp. FACHB-1365]|uniref:hypothetical protein n=1 Tax=Planktothrix sp. FACHB-1365 TaxID=2692855 RepID=UPI001689CD5B|nr:hypothetical protein [Planktothrix sp. FACHB-1365]MBD2483945.1 hypothetical protein [Planktothrix sp. FACHB-1365]